MAEAAESIPEKWNVYQLVAAVQAELAKRGISKDQKNTFDNYNFRGIDDVYNALAPILSKHGLVIFPEVLDRTVVERQSQKGGALFHVTLDVVYHFVSIHDGSQMLVPVPGEAMDRGDKAINKAMSAAYKLACFQTFCIPIAGQDSENETHEVQTASTVTDEQADEIKQKLKATNSDTLAFLKVMGGHRSVDELPAAVYPKAISALNKKIKQQESTNAPA